MPAPAPARPLLLLALVASALVAGCGARQPATASTTSANANASASASAGHGAGSGPAGAAAPRDPLPAGFQLVRERGFSFGVPARWQRLATNATEAALYGGPGAPREGVFAVALATPFEGSLDTLVGIAMQGMDPAFEVVARARSAAGADPAVDLVTRRTAAVHSEMLVLVASSPQVEAVFACGGGEGEIPAALAICQRVVDSVRLGGGPRAPGAGTQVVAGDGWTLELPASWVERSSHGAEHKWGPAPGEAPLSASITMSSRAAGNPTPLIDQVLSNVRALRQSTIRDRHDARQGAQTRTTFIAAADPQVTTFEQVHRFFVHGDTGVALACAAARAFTPEDRGLCRQILESARGD